MAVQKYSTSIKIDSIYFLKALCALFVVIIHSAMWGKEAIEPIIHIAVPCFFAISGYFLYSGNDTAELSKVRRWVKKVAFTYLFIAIFYGVFLYFYNGKTYTWKDIIIAVVIGTTPSFHLWYLISMLQALLIVWFLKRFHLWNVWILLPIFISEYVFRSCLSHKIIDIIYLDLWKPFWALLLLGIGYYSSKYQFSRYSIQIFLPVFLCALLLKYYAGCLAPDVARLLVMMCDIIIPACLISLCVKFPGFSFPFLVRIGKEHSANIYYFHMFVYLLLNKIFVVDFGDKLFPLVTYIVTLVFSEFLYCLRLAYSRFLQSQL